MTYLESINTKLEKLQENGLINESDGDKIFDRAYIKAIYENTKELEKWMDNIDDDVEKYVKKISDITTIYSKDIRELSSCIKEKNKAKSIQKIEKAKKDMNDLKVLVINTPHYLPKEIYKKCFKMIKSSIIASGTAIKRILKYALIGGGIKVGMNAPNIISDYIKGSKRAAASGFDNSATKSLAKRSLKKHFKSGAIVGAGFGLGDNLADAMNANSLKINDYDSFVKCSREIISRGIQILAKMEKTISKMK